MAGNDVYERPAVSNPCSDSDYGVEVQRQIDYDPTKEKAWKTKQVLINACQNEVGCISSGERPINIAVIGPPGCGKSSLLNSIFAAFSDGKWNERTAVGDYGGSGKQVSQWLVSYPKGKYYTRRTDNGDDDDVLMPTFIDMKGFENDYNDYNKELLKIVFFGRLKEFEKFPDVLQYKDEGIKGLQQKYGQRNPYLKVDKIIFVCSADPKALLPTELMKSVCEVACDQTHIPIYGVLTKADKFSNDISEVKTREEQFRKHLGIPATRFARVKNYCEDVIPDIRYRFRVVPELDVRVLNLMHQVFSNALSVLNADADPYNNVKNAEEIDGNTTDTTKNSRVPSGPPRVGNFSMSTIFILMTIQVLLIAMSIHFCLKPAVDSTKINNICAKYDMMKKKNNETWPDLEELCAQKTDVLKPPIETLCVCLVFIIVIVPLVFHGITQRNGRERAD